MPHSQAHRLEWEQAMKDGLSRTIGRYRRMTYEPDTLVIPLNLAGLRDILDTFEELMRQVD